MSVRFELEDGAKVDFWNTFEYYYEIDPDLGIQFHRDFDNSVEHILQFPNSGTNVENNQQRILLDRFPHYIIYEITEPNLIVCFAVGHIRRSQNIGSKTKMAFSSPAFHIMITYQ